MVFIKKWEGTPFNAVRPRRKKGRQSVLTLFNWKRLYSDYGKKWGRIDESKDQGTGEGKRTCSTKLVWSPEVKEVPADSCCHPTVSVVGTKN